MNKIFLKFSLVIMMFLIRMAFVLPNFAITQAQTTRFQYPVWHPTQNIIAVTNGAYLRFYNSDFSQFIKEFELLNQIDVVITDIEWSTNGMMIAIGLQGDNIPTQLQVWDYESGQLVNQFFDFGISSNIEWSNDNSSIYFIHHRNLGDDTIRKYTVSSGVLAAEFSPPVQSIISSIALSSNNAQIAIDLRGTVNGLYFLDLQTNNLIQSNLNFRSDSIEIPNFIYYPHDSNLVGIEKGFYNKISVINTNTNEIIAVLDGHERDVTDIDWVNNQIVTTGYDDTARFWDSVTFTQIRVLQIGSTPKLSFSPSGDFFVGDSYDVKTVVVRDSFTGEIVASLDPITLPTRTPYPTATLSPTVTSTPLPTATPYYTPTSVACDVNIPSGDTLALSTEITNANTSGVPTTICLDGGLYPVTGYYQEFFGKTAFAPITTHKINRWHGNAV
jgi:hypothetical protein